MVHVRKKFENALATTPEAKQAHDSITLLYMLVGNLKAEDVDYEKISKEREAKACPILQQIEIWMKHTYNKLYAKRPIR